VVGQLQGALAASVMTAGPDDLETAGAVSLLAPLVGRVAVDDWPTGVAWTWAQQHGGPWPATTAPAATSVGAAALDRFTRPVAYQSVPDAALPTALRADNRWRLPRRVDGRLEVPS
jgi:NADP-dependent aldehyde dehydrogenase